MECCLICPNSAHIFDKIRIHTPAFSLGFSHRERRVPVFRTERALTNACGRGRRVNMDKVYLRYAQDVRDGGHWLDNLFGNPI